jgi:hypothetical protein
VLPWGVPGKHIFVFLFDDFEVEHDFLTLQVQS